MDRSGDELGRPAGASKLRLRTGAFELIGAGAAAIALVFLMLPLVAIFVNGDLMAGLRSEEARQSLWLSLQTSLVSLAIMVVFGTPIAHLLATRQFRGRTLVVGDGSVAIGVRTTSGDVWLRAVDGTSASESEGTAAAARP